ncbi:alpha-1,3-mannosyl-glycoprotein 4-beta-N-acetylglucosaminyltransferase B-like isoform X1 [Hypomesus transpacificus]|uniref:alpha-1,3-mannosyl-glycoprotein 4-beta-N-acetylglucosaminyltransferase B-like isoform X1 n=1 Tax=Hypomesus transpacificus TaxID=137520 RepID=UPI001F07B7FA|nr:alpha-1,3-mannosyl-glycoprotein 4-beta-N-acetylglucosaminyltransferase B-like isoform X1 [Hypomesus transpacificus]
MRLKFFKLICLLALGSFLSLTWFTAVREKKDAVNPRMLVLFERLLVAESKGQLLSVELSRVLGHFKNLNKTQNITEKEKWSALSPLLPNPYLYLPHLRDHPDSLTPNVLLGQGRMRVSLVLGIPTVKRAKQTYLVSTLNSLLYDLTPSERNDMLIIVFVAETDIEYVRSVAATIEKNFPKDVQSGLLEVVSPSQYFYPNFSSLRETFGDTKDRVKWRTKQNLDYSYLMLYAQDKGTYYVQLEDDIVAKPKYSLTMKDCASQRANQDWLFLEFSQLGFIGKMFRTSELPMIAEFFLMFHKDKPIDWLLDHILWVKACNPEKDAKDCNQQKAVLKHRFTPSLFQHVGLHSSLPGKLQHLKDKDFGKQPQYVGHSNPPAELSSSLKHYQQHSLERAYRGQDFFWGLSPTTGDYILIHFTQPLKVRGYRFRSGNLETNGDRFYNTTVEALPSDGLKRDMSHGYQILEDGFIVIGSFADGVAEGNIHTAIQSLSAIRLMVHSDSDVWVLLSEVWCVCVRLCRCVSVAVSLRLQGKLGFP